MEQNRLKSWVTWSAIVAQIIAILQLSGVFEKIGIATEQVEQVIGCVLQLLVLFGVLNNPTSADSF